MVFLGFFLAWFIGLNGFLLLKKNLILKLKLNLKSWVSQKKTNRPAAAAAEKANRPVAKTRRVATGCPTGCPTYLAGSDVEVELLAGPLGADAAQSAAAGAAAKLQLHPVARVADRGCRLGCKKKNKRKTIVNFNHRVNLHGLMLPVEFFIGFDRVATS